MTIVISNAKCSPLDVGREVGIHPRTWKAWQHRVGATSQRESNDILISPVTKWVVIGGSTPEESTRFIPAIAA